MSEQIEIDQDELKRAIKQIMEYCQNQGMTEFIAYMAMISITNTMEENLGFSYKRNTQS